MAVTPNTVVHFLNVPLENNYKNQIYFDNRSNQTTFMMTKRVQDTDGNPMTFSNLTYQRKDNVIRVPLHIDKMINANYVMYQNTSYSDRWFYAFITKMEYINDGRTDVYIETDVWQTWFDKITLKDSFVEREHVTDDVAGNHTVPEGLETGEYICNAHSTDETMDELLNDFECVISASTAPIAGTAEDTITYGGIYNNLYSGLRYYASGSTAIDTLISLYDQEGRGDSINGLFIAPSFLCKRKEGTDIPGEIARDTDLVTHTIAQSKNVRLNGYTPKNKKLLTYPYNYLLVSNNSGGSVVYQYEHFEDDSTMEFKVKSALCPGCSIRMLPQDYKGVAENDEEGLNLGKFPICNWSTDMYTNWLTQNSVNIGLDYLKSGVQIAGGVGGIALAAATGGVGFAAGAAGAASIYSGVMGIADTMAQKYQHSLVPPQANGNLNCGDVITADGKNTFHFYKMSIKQEYARMIDKYFEMFGYKVNTVKTPVLNSRPCWNYIKTIGVNLDGQAPQEDLKKIRQMFDNGVTFWKNGNKVEDYSQNNH